jgi:hypothetical protein
MPVQIIEGTPAQLPAGLSHLLSDRMNPTRSLAGLATHSEAPQPSIEVHHDAHAPNAFGQRPEKRSYAHGDIAQVERHRAPAPEPRHVSCELLGAVSEDVGAKLRLCKQHGGELSPRGRGLVLWQIEVAELQLYQASRKSRICRAASASPPRTSRRSANGGGSFSTFQRRTLVAASSASQRGRPRRMLSAHRRSSTA